jgi:hypothetical protein
MRDGSGLTYRLRQHARSRWSGHSDLEIRFRGAFAYIEGHATDGTTIKLCRLCCSGSASTWGFALYRASYADYEDSLLPSGMPAGSSEEALDCACGVYLVDPTAWLPETPTN